MNLRKAKPCKENDQDNNTLARNKKHGTLSAVQRACLRYILLNPSCTRWQLGKAINRGWSPDVVQYLRQKGIKVITDMRKVKDCNRPIGFYSIDPDYRDSAWHLLGGKK